MPTIENANAATKAEIVEVCRGTFLEVNSETVGNPFVINKTDTATNAPTLGFIHRNVSGGGPSGDGWELGSIVFDGVISGGAGATHVTGAEILAIQDGAAGVNYTDAELLFGTSVGGVLQSHVKITKGGTFVVGVSNFSHAVVENQVLDHKTVTAKSTNDPTLTAAEIIGGIITRTGTGASADTLPTVANLVAAITDAGALLTDGFLFGFEFVILNSRDNTITVTTNTGWTLSGTMTIATNKWRRFRVEITTASAATLYNLGAGDV